MTGDITLTPAQVAALRAAADGHLVSRLNDDGYREIWDDRRHLIVDNETIRPLHGHQLVDLEAVDFDTVRIVITDAGRYALDGAS